mgnify:CR=1 FL=1
MLGCEAEIRHAKKRIWPGGVDFDALVVRDGLLGLKPKVYTFGGDRETFDFSDPTNYLNVDNDVWRFAPPAD